MKSTKNPGKRTKLTLVKSAALFTFFFLLFNVDVNAQQVISAAGNHYETEDRSISWTLGETVVETFTTDENILTQGFHQTVLTVLSINDMDGGPGYRITAFPNPVKSHLTLSIDAEKHDNMQFMLYSYNGSLVKQGVIGDKNTEISFEGLKPAPYFIRVIEQNQHISTIKIIKN